MKHNWEYKRLGDVCFTKKEIGRASTYYGVDDEISYFDISSIDNSVNRVTSYFTTTFGDAPSRAQQVIENGDVLFSLVRPNLKNIALLNSDAANKVGTSGFCVLRGKNVLPKYVLHFVLSSQFTEYILSKASGASYPAVTEDDVRKASIPVPTMEIQEQIVAELDKINELIEQNRELLCLLDSLAQSLFYDTFGDPVTNPKGWEMVTLEDVCTLKSGDSSANKLPFGKTPYVKVGDMNLPENKTYIQTSSNFVDIGGKNKLLFPIGTTIFPKRGGAILTNKKRLTKTEICCDLNIMGAIPKNINSKYLFFYFILKDFSELVDGSTVPQINNGDIYPLKIQLPPLSLQEQFAAKVEAIEAQKATVEKSIVELQTLLDSRMDYWFN